MRFLSTRGLASQIGFREAVLSGLAPDGGLYVPARWPQISVKEQASFAGMGFAEVAASILSRFADAECPESDLRAMTRKAYASFDAGEVAPLRRLDDDTFLLELFHGPTLAFKDIAMCLLAELYGWALEGRKGGKTIIGATSGDTGGAAIHAFAGKPNVEVFMLHPKGRISEVQRRIMTTVADGNIVNIAVDGSFDDCQRIVKALFADEALSSRFDLGGVNSINWVRLAIQTVYYFTATAAVGAPASFIVPTGNFGDVFAGFAAKRMELPVNRLAIAVNANDILKRTLATGVYEPRATYPTSSPSMDIQVASNFERLLFEACGRHVVALRDMMRQLDDERRIVLPEPVKSAIVAEFVAESADEDEVARKIGSTFKVASLLVDPHTAVGLVAIDKLRASGAIKGAAVAISTAHPAKFPQAVAAAAGVHPNLPSRYLDLFDRTERMLEAPADAKAIGDLIEQRSSYAKGAMQ